MTQTIETPLQSISNDHSPETRRTETCETYNNMATMCDFYPEAHILFNTETMEIAISTPSQNEFDESQRKFDAAYKKIDGSFVKRSLYKATHSLGVTA